MKWFKAGNKQSGVTLVELIITMGLMSMFLVLLTSIFTASIDVQSGSVGYAAVTTNGRFALARLAYDIRRASSIATPASLGDSGASLVLTVDSQTLTYALDSGRLQLTVDGDSDYLTPPDVTVTGLNFQKLGTSGHPASVRYSFTLSADTNHAVDSQHYTSTTELRP